MVRSAAGLVLSSVLLTAGASAAQSRAPLTPSDEDELRLGSSSRQVGRRVLVVADAEAWEQQARFFVGVRSGVAIPPGGVGVSPTIGAELGVTAPKGIGFGLHLYGAQHPPAVRLLNTPPADWALGAEMDMRFYFETVEPLTLYPTFSIGFLAGPARDTGENVVLPMINPGFGARVKMGTMYVSFEFGLASFTIPFLNVALGWDFDRKTRAVALQDPVGSQRRAAPPVRTPAPPAVQPQPGDRQPEGRAPRLNRQHLDPLTAEFGAWSSYSN